MNWDLLLGVLHLALAAFGLVWVGRLLRTARIYLSWLALLYYALAWLLFAGLMALRLAGGAALDTPRQVVWLLFFLGLAGCLFEHVRADGRRARDARRLLEQWRLAGGQARQRAGGLKVLNERLAHLAVTDDLTGLPNRRRFVEALRAEAQRARRYERWLSLVMLDLDGLKTVNDRHGHAAGDAALRAVAQVLRDSVRDTDLPARLSGDEFAVLLPETDAGAALPLAERIRAEVAAFQVPVEGGAVGITVSLGLVSAEGQALPELPRFLRLADEALYRAKADGRNTLAVSPGPGSQEALPAFNH